jgi:hypothetical protein
MKSTTRHTIAMIIITALVITSFASLSQPSSASSKVTVVSEQPTSMIEIQTQLEHALTPNRTEFQPRHFVSITTPNFSEPIRRAPIRRKGRVQH